MNDASKVAMLIMVVDSAFSASRKLDELEGQVERLLIVLLGRDPEPEEVHRVLRTIIGTTGAKPCR